MHRVGDGTTIENPVKVWHPEEMNPAFAAAVNSGDIENLLALYESDALLAPRPGERARGTDEIRLALSDHVTLSLEVARSAAPRMRPGGTLIFMGGTGGRKISRELGIISAATAALPPFAAALALELAPVRVNLIAAGFVDTPLSASLLGDQLEARREELRTTLPIGRVVGPADVAALAVHIMTNTALTGATYDIDGGQQFVA